LSITESLLRHWSATPARPIITHYDDAAGTRVELSVATLVNWAAKTANWLVEDLDVIPGTPVAVLLPAHWQTAGILLGAWWCGAHVTDSPADAAVTLIPPFVPAPETETVAVASLHPMGLPLPEPQGLDYITETRLHADDFLPLTPVPGTTPALLGSTVDELLARASSRAESLSLTEKSRILSTVEWTLPDGLIDGFLAPLSAGASIVQVSHSDPAKLPAHRTAERTTTDLLLT
jgi:uncharacterized protein (TIGR03089 family)